MHEVKFLVQKQGDIKMNMVYETKEKSIGGIKIDAFTNESYSFTNSATDIAVEDGGNITDNIIENNDEISITGFIGSTEFLANSSLPETVTIPNSMNQRIIQMYQELLRLKRERVPITLTTGLDVFDNMIILSLDIPRDVSTGANLEFTMKFKRIPIIKSKTAPITSSNAPETIAKDQVQSTAETGVQNKEQVSEENNLMKERWKAGVARGDWTEQEYLERWGEPYEAI